ncbi:pimeloyl-ACP methyl ester carboxylesterase [Lentzea flaviverrucosa]|uniref:Pimeloyl-ACP methyl ester carboxylesterase n=2 Tax=Lentzea flaviverrucosa TaxID=200379 RepID=A0A1H9AEZ8_9PSEU|nr:pimeloyl-ACP methyl ester carboxylesterase [Lentzea flaviverrucosa]SEP75067.1 Pimeloyl-ACP methyl ester carboxylesterase [Lentzea flaviverrucosa]
MRDGVCGMTTVTTADGQLVSYVDHGGDGPAVVLLHSFLMDASMWAPQVEALGDRYRLVAIDERGHGATPATAPFDHWDVARDALAVLDELKIGSAAVAGTSQGGFVALRMALLAPERVTALVLLGTSGETEDQQISDAYQQLAEVWIAQGPETVTEAVAKICLGEYDPSEWTPKWSEVEPERLRLIMNALVGREGVLDRVTGIDVPALVLHGTADLAYPVAKAEALVAALPEAEPLVLVEGGAHFLSLTHAADVNPHLERFLSATL